MGKISLQKDFRQKSVQVFILLKHQTAKQSQVETRTNSHFLLGLETGENYRTSRCIGVKWNHSVTLQTNNTVRFGSKNQFGNPFSKLADLNMISCLTWLMLTFSRLNWLCTFDLVFIVLRSVQVHGSCISVQRIDGVGVGEQLRKEWLKDVGEVW